MITPQQIVGIGIRLLALLIAIRFAYILCMVFAYPDAQGNALTFALALAGCIVAVLLWVFPMTVAHRIIPRTRHDNVVNGNVFQLARVGACLIGLGYGAHALTNLCAFAYFATVVTATDGRSFFSAIGPARTGQLVILLAELVIAIVISKQAAWFAAHVCGLKTPAAATDEPAPPADAA